VRRLITRNEVVLYISVGFECCVLLGRSLCDWLFPCTEESYGWMSVLNVVFCQV